MIFYHGTSEEKWRLIQEEGILWGYNIHKDENGKSYRGYRYTYLTPDIEVARGFDKGVMLEIKYEPVGVDGTGTDNYCFEHNIPEPDRSEGAFCWQFSVFVPISLEYVKRIK